MSSKRSQRAEIETLDRIVAGTASGQRMQPEDQAAVHRFFRMLRETGQVRPDLLHLYGKWWQEAERSPVYNKVMELAAKGLGGSAIYRLLKADPEVGPDKVYPVRTINHWIALAKNSGVLASENQFSSDHGHDDPQET